MIINKRVQFCAAHSIKDAGKCANKHGHNWEANITVELIEGELDDRGFVVDVRDLKNTAFRYDHDDLDKYFETPSTENVAQQIAEDALALVVEQNSHNIVRVTVHLIETENNSATATASNVISKLFTDTIPTSLTRSN